MITQLLLNGLVSGLVLSLVAIGFHLVFQGFRLFHLAHGALYTCGAYFFIALLPGGQPHGPLSVILALAGALVLEVVLCWVVEVLVYRPLVTRKAGQAITLISSMGVYLFLVNFIALLFGNQSRYLQHREHSSLVLGGVIFTPVQQVQTAVTLLLLGGLWLVSRRQRFLPIKAVLSNPAVASVIGVPVRKVRLTILILSTLLAAVAAILRLYDSGILPTAGMGVTLSASAAVIIGGSRSIGSTIVASLLIAVVQSFTGWYLSSQWQEGMTFLLLIIVILWKTEGILPFKMRIEEK